MLRKSLDLYIKLHSPKELVEYIEAYFNELEGKLFIDYMTDEEISKEFEELYLKHLFSKIDVSPRGGEI